MTLKSNIDLLIGSHARNCLLAFLCVFIIATVATAQDSVYPNTQRADAPRGPGKSLELGTSQLGFWAGYSSDNPTLIGRATDRPLFELNVQYARVLRTGDNWALKYIAEIIPMMFIKQPQQGRSASGNPVDVPGTEEKIYGIGASPIGLQMNFRRG